MTTEARPRFTSDDDRGGQRSRARAVRPDRDYGAYTSGANALRLDSIFSADDFEPPQWSPRAQPVRRTDAAARSATVDRAAAAGRSERPATVDASGMDRRAGGPNRTSQAGPNRVSQAGPNRTSQAPTASRTTTAPRPGTVSPKPGRARRLPWLTDVTGQYPTVTATSPSAQPVAALPLPRAPFVVLMIVLVVVGVVGVLVLNTKINEDSFRLADLRANQAALDLQEQQLNQQLYDLEQPGNLRAAATRLGLIPAGDPAFINLPDGRVVGVPQPASAR